MRMRSLFLMMVLLSVLAACGGGEASTDEGAGDAAAGQTVFSAVAVPACTTCHSLEPGVRGIGPSLATIGAEAGSRIVDVSAQEYLRDSIAEPSAFVVEGYGDVMSNTYGTQLSAKQLNDLIAYLLTLK